jgi:hypothetical protein
MVGISGLEAAVAIAEIDAAVGDFPELKQGKLHVLGREWEMCLAVPNNDVRKAGSVQYLARKQGVKLLLLQTARQVMEQQAAAKGDGRFFELAYRQAEIRQPNKLTMGLALSDFVTPNTELIREEVRSKVKR